MDEEERMNLYHGSAIAAANAARFQMLASQNPMLFQNPSFTQAQSYFQNLANQQQQAVAAQQQQQAILRKQQESLAKGILPGVSTTDTKLENRQPLTPSNSHPHPSNPNSYHTTPSSVKTEPTTPARRQLPPSSDTDNQTTPHRTGFVMRQVNSLNFLAKQNSIQEENEGEDLDQTLTENNVQASNLNHSGNHPSMPNFGYPSHQNLPNSGLRDNNETHQNSGQPPTSQVLTNLTNKLLAAKNESGISSNSPLSNNSNTSSRSGSHTTTPNNFPPEFKHLLSSLNQNSNPAENLGQQALRQLSQQQAHSNTQSPAQQQLTNQAIALQAKAKQAASDAAQAAARAAQAAAVAQAALPSNSPISKLLDFTKFSEN